MKSLEASHDNSPLGIVVNAIHEDELAYRLTEINMVRPPSFQWHRYQIILVNRDDKIVEWWDDLGPSSNFTASPLSIPALWLHTVAELRAIAEETREGDNYWVNRSKELVAESALTSDVIDFYEETRKVINNRSVSGPSISKQRNGFYKSHLRK